MVQKFFLVGEDEIADFHGSLKLFGFSTDDFELSETVTQSVGTISGTMTVSRCSSGVTKSYTAGHSSSWPAEVDDDLRHGIFGKP